MYRQRWFRWPSAVIVCTSQCVHLTLHLPRVAFLRLERGFVAHLSVALVVARFAV
jgi:hypothetical protein